MNLTALIFLRIYNYSIPLHKKCLSIFFNVCRDEPNKTTSQKVTSVKIQASEIHILESRSKILKRIWQQGEKF
jgi:hypothetical protein